MKPIILNTKNTETPGEEKSRSLYLQVYDQIKSQILQGEASAGEKLPSLRILSRDL